MSSIPTRVATAIRPSASPGLLAASAAVGATFTSTPFLIPAVSNELGVAIGAAAAISTAQVGGFTLTNLLAGRRLSASARLVRASLVALVALNLASAVAADVVLLVGLRFVAGAAMGLITWVGWVDTATDGRRRGEIAAIGPLVAAVAAPPLGMLVDANGLVGGYLALAAVGAAAAAMPLRVAGTPPVRNPGRPTRAAAVLLAALGAMATAGSAVFVFAAVIGQDEVGLSATTVSLVFSANALVGIPAARYAGRRRVPGLWMGVTGLAALAVATVHHPVVFMVALTVWGGAFWLAVPEAFNLLAERSRLPSERIGDAQAIMSAGRVFGPLAGGLLIDTGSYLALGISAALVIGLAAIGVELVATSHRRR